MIAWLVQHAVFVIPLAVCVAIICRLVRPAPAVCHALWLLVLIKLVVPPVPVWRSAWLDQWLVGQRTIAEQATDNDTLTAASIPPRSTDTPSGPRTGITARVIDVLVTESKDTATVDESMVVQPPSAAATDETRSAAIQPLAEPRNARLITPAAAWDLAQPVLLSLWALGAGVAFACQLRRIVRLVRALRTSVPPAQSFTQYLAVQCRALRIGVPRVRLCTGLSCPMVVALPRATLLWPASLDQRLDAAGLRAVLLHELAHLKRRDHLTAWLEVAVACLWWWHPIVWWARRELREYAELACDAWVVAQLPESRTRYAKALVDVCEFISLAKPATAPAVGMARGNRRSFERRLHMILRQRIAARMPIVAWIGIVAAALLALPGFSTATGQVEQDDDSALPSLAKGESTTRTAVPEDTSTKGTPAESEIVGVPMDAGDYIAREVREAQVLLQEMRDAKRIHTRNANQIAETLTSHAKSMRRWNDKTDDQITTEMFLQILQRRPNGEELAAWRRHVEAVGSGKVEQLVQQLIRSPEFLGRKEAPANANNAFPQPYRAKQAKVQTLLRVVYDMPSDKGEVLAKFLNDYVKGEIEARTDEEGLVVTAEAGIQRTVAGIVSLMTGEPVALDLGDAPPVGHATIPTRFYGTIDRPHTGTTPYIAPTPVAQPVPPGVYPTAPPATRVPSSFAPGASNRQPTTVEESPAIQRFPGGIDN
jgi:beta-lactamase regulating signal transducer with metallopeptidase domain